ncbi:MAG: glycoside hydrolase family 16 protein, partial [Acidobacteria bacterium]|nr:glycoside hydrolase family 16 protein [Acidobacteriota bacterium]
MQQRQTTQVFHGLRANASGGQTGLAWQGALLLFAGLLLGSCRATGTSASPAIEFTQVPPTDAGGPNRVEPIAGRVTGARAGQRLVLFARSGVWWVQPTRNQPFTAIQADSQWKSSIHLGTEYAALLVAPGYRPPATLDELPASGGDVAAVAVVKGAGTLAATVKPLNFSGYEWKVRSAPSERGGKLNAYAPANVWTDARGALHLRLTQRASAWDCAEVQLTRSLGYGTYLFTVQETAHLEPAAVLSLFTWDDLEAKQNHREIDIELTRWGDPASKNAQYAIQPYYVPANVARFAAPAGVLTHSFRWEPGRVVFSSVRGRGIRGATPIAG